MAFKGQICILSIMCFSIIVAQQQESYVANWLAKQSKEFERNQMIKNGEQMAEGCEEEKITIKCSNRFTRMEIVKTFYGRDNTITCPSSVLKTNKICEEPANDVAKKVVDLCEGENKCKIPVNIDFLGHGDSEICPGIRKYLRVVYKCTQHPKIKAECPNNCNKTCWPLCKEDCCHPPPPPTPPPTPPPPPPQTPPPQAVPSPGPVSTQSLSSNTQGTSSVLSLQQNQERFPQCPMPCKANCAPLCLLSCCNPIPAELLSPRISNNAAVDVPKGFACPAPCSANCLPACTIECCKNNLPQYDTMSQQRNADLQNDAQQQTPPSALPPANFMAQATNQNAYSTSQNFRPLYNANRNSNIYSPNNHDATYNAAAAAWNYRSKIWRKRMQLQRQAAARRVNAANAVRKSATYSHFQNPYIKDTMPKANLQYQYTQNRYYGK